MFRVLHGEFKDLVTSLPTKAKPLSYADVHSHLLPHKFLYNTFLQSMVVNRPLLPTSPLPPRQMYPSISPLPLIATILISVVTKDVFMAASVLTTVTTTNTCMIFVAFRGLLTPTGSKASDNKIERILALHIGLLTTPLRIMSSVNSTSLLAIQPLNALSFVAMYSSRLPILLLIMSLLLILWIGP